MRLHHVQITISGTDQEEARAFYGEMLELREIPKPESLKSRGGMWFELGQIQLHIGVEAFAHREQTKAHIAYEVDNLEEIKKRLQAQGCPIKESIPIPGLTRFESRDPFGNRLEFLKQTPND